MFKMSIKFHGYFLLLFHYLATIEGLSLAPMYRNEMVLQMEPKRSQIWGTGERFAEIKVTLKTPVVQEFYSTVAYNDSWSVQLSPQPAGGPYEIVITESPMGRGSETHIYLQNITFGDVWVCIGEGNMELSMSDALNASDHISKAMLYKELIKVAEVSMKISRVEEQDLYMEWLPISTESASVFSAICLMFGMRMSDALRGKRTIGLIQLTQEVTPIESWVSAGTIASCNTPPSKPGLGWVDKAENSALWNGTISPLTKLSVRGVIWAQGESNVGYNPDLYQCHLLTFFQDLTDKLFDGKVPVPNEHNVMTALGILQSGSMQSDRMNGWGPLRWAQTFGNGILPSDRYYNFFMATSYDLTDVKSPYGKTLPREKYTPARRLGNAAAAMLYGQGDDGAKFGPYAQSATRDASGVVGLEFNTNITLEGTEGFTYRMSNGQWLPVSKFLQISQTRVGVAVPKDAVALAYGWGANPCPNRCAIYGAGKDGLPAQPWLWSIRGADATTEGLNDVGLKPEVILE